MVVIMEAKPYITRHGFTWKELCVFFQTIAAMKTSEGTVEYGIVGAAGDIVASIKDIEHAPITYTSEYAIVALGAGSLAHYLNLLKKEGRGEHEEATLLCLKVFMSMICRYEFTQVHLLTVATQVLAYLKEAKGIPPYTRLVLEESVKAAEQGVFADTTALRNDLLQYIEKMQNDSGYELDKRKQAIEACCIILGFFH